MSGEDCPAAGNVRIFRLGLGSHYVRHASKRMGHQSPCPRGRTSACPSRYVVTSLFRHETGQSTPIICASLHPSLPLLQRLSLAGSRLYASNKVGDKMKSVYDVDDGRDWHTAARLPTRGVSEPNKSTTFWFLSPANAAWCCFRSCLSALTFESLDLL